MLLSKFAKSGGLLMPEDFRKFPVWTWSENDRSLCPLLLSDTTIDSTEFDEVFMLADLVLNDGTCLQGEAMVDPYRKTVYNLHFFRGDEVFEFSGKLVHGHGTLDQLAAWLNKAVDAITPVTYSTPYFYQGGKPICGTVDLRQW